MKYLSHPSTSSILSLHDVKIRFWVSTTIFSTKEEQDVKTNKSDLKMEFWLKFGQKIKISKKHLVILSASYDLRISFGTCRTLQARVPYSRHLLNKIF